MAGYQHPRRIKPNRALFTERGGTIYDTTELVGDKTGQGHFLSQFQGADRVRARQAIEAAQKAATTHDD